jgi:hypothetical protein
VVLLDPDANDPHPEAAATVNVAGLPLAVPPVVGFTVNQAAGGLVVVSIVKGVPPVAAEVTDTVCAAPGV